MHTSGFVQDKYTIMDMRHMHIIMMLTLAPVFSITRQPTSGLGKQVAELRAKVEKNETAVAHVTSTMTELNTSVPRYESVLEEMNLKLEILEVKSTTGVYIWKVSPVVGGQPAWSVWL